METRPADSKLSNPRLTLLCLTVAVVVLPLTFSKPGLPLQLKADEPGYYMMAQSLWHDHDLRCEVEDLERLFREFPIRTQGLILMSDDGWQTAYYSAPFVYSLLAAPAAGVLGANGLVLTNAILLMASVWMATSYLGRHNSEGLSTLFACGYFLFSLGFVYVFWLQPEVLGMACVTAAFLLAFEDPRRERAARILGRIRGRYLMASAAAGAVLALVVYGKPPFALLLLPLGVAVFSDRGWRGVTALVSGCSLALVLVAALAWQLTGRAWPYLSEVRRPVNVSSPVLFAERKLEPLAERQDGWVKPSGWEAVLEREAPRLTALPVLRDNIASFLWGRHVGFLPYMPFAVATTMVFFLGRGRASPRRWTLLLAVFLASGVFMYLLPSEWHGSGGSIGNRYLATVYPAFLFLATRLPPVWPSVAAYGAASLFLGPLLLTPFGAPVREPTLQAHTRNFPLRHLPLEFSLLRNIPGYVDIYSAGAAFHCRKDAVLAKRNEIWIHGSMPVECLLMASEPLEEVDFGVRSLAPRSRVTLCLQRACETLLFEGDESETQRRVRLRPGRSARQHLASSGDVFVHRLRVRTSSGEQPRWRSNGQEDFYLGAALTYLGSVRERQRDVFHARWTIRESVSEAAAGSRLTLPIRVRNASAETWPADGPLKVALSYHWYADDGALVVWDGLRTELPADLHPGEEIELEQIVATPDDPGSYDLSLDLVREDIDWFSRRGSGSPEQIGISMRIVPPAEDLVASE